MYAVWLRTKNCCYTDCYMFVRHSLKKQKLLIYHDCSYSSAEMCPDVLQVGRQSLVLCTAKTSKWASLCFCVWERDGKAKVEKREKRAKERCWRKADKERKIERRAKKKKIKGRERERRTETERDKCREREGEAEKEQGMCQELSFCATRQIPDNNIGKLLKR